MTRPSLRSIAPALPMIIALLTVAFAAFQQPSDIPAWAFPGTRRDSTIADSTRLHRVPNSEARFTLPQVVDLFAPPDWHPAGHPAMPDVVARGRKPKVFACAYCHLPNGLGRPENATLSGLSEDYIIAQLEAMRTSARQTALPDWIPSNSMHTVAANATEAEVAAAARYFSALRPAPRVRVIEATRVPLTRQAGFVYARIPGKGTEPIGSRIVEGPPDFERHELHDDAMTYLAYVPPGSIKRGRSIARTGTNGVATACITCHGPTLAGVGPIPPLAGRYPTYIVRQLVAFKTGARSTPASQPMQVVAGGLSVDDMIAVAAYAASLRPAAH